MGKKPQPYLVLFALWLMVFSASSQVIIIAPILPRIGETLGVEESSLGLLITVYAVMLSIFALITGPISDTIGRRRVLLIGSGSMAVALLFHALADSFSALLFVRAAAGAAGGMLSGGAVSYVGDYFPYERRGWANGWVMSGIAFGQIIGIPAGTIIADAFGFRGAFLMFAVTMALATLLIALFVPQPDVARRAEPLTVKGAILTYSDLLHRKVVVVASAAFFFMFFSLGLYVIYLPTWLEQTLSVSGASIASLFLVGGIANVISGPLAGRLSDVVGRKPMIVQSCAALGVLMVLTPFTIRSMPVAYVFFAIAMALVAIRISPMQSLLTELVTADRRGALMSLTVAIGQIGIGIGSALAGPAYARWGYESNTIAAAVAIMTTAALVYHGLPEPRLKKPNAQASAL